MSNLSGKNCVLTGCTAGIGEALAFQLAEPGVSLKTLIIINRSKSKADDLIARLKAPPISATFEIHNIIADLGEPDQVKRACDEVKALSIPIHAVISNAGIWLGDKKTYPKDVVQKNKAGHEMHFATNYLSCNVLCTELQPLLAQAAGESGTPSRVVITGSLTSIEMAKGVIDVANLDGSEGTTSGKQPLNNDVVYAQSKLCQHMWARHFAKGCASSNGPIHVVVCCPGAVFTNIDAWRSIKKMMKCCFCVIRPRTPAQGARPLFWAATAEFSQLEQLEKTNGEPGLFVDTGKRGEPDFRDTDKVVSKLEYYKQYKKTAPDTADWGRIAKLVEYTDKALGR